MSARWGASNFSLILLCWVTPVSPLGQPTTVRDSAPDTQSVCLTVPDTETIIDSAKVPRERLVEFHRHARSNRFGYFIDEKQMAALHVSLASEALRRVPGVTVRPSRGIGNQVRIRGCAPRVWVDGERASGAELDEVAHGEDVAAIEVYRSLTGVPAEFTDRDATCGTIVVWLKSG